MHANPACDVICVGLIVADHVCAPIESLPRPGGIVLTPHLTLTIGGCAANVGVDLAKLGIPVSLVGCVGDDGFGRFVREQLELSGVDCRHVTVSSTSQTATTMVVNVKGEDRRFIHVVGANTELTGQEISDELLAGAKVLYVGGFGLNPELSGTHIAERFASARRFGVMTILDVVLDDPEIGMQMVRDVLPETDLFLPNRDEATLLTGRDDPLAQAEQFLDDGAQTVVITQGEQGAVFKDQAGRTIEVPAFPCQQVDGTGGGDAFVAGYIHGLLQQSPIEKCLAYGSAMGASCVRSAGATTGVFDAEELEEFVREHPLPSTG